MVIGHTSGNSTIGPGYVETRGENRGLVKVR